MKMFILSAFVLSPLFAMAQSFYVSAKDNKSREIIMNKIRFEGFPIAGDSTKSDFTMQFLVDGKYKVVSLKQPYKGYIKIINTHSGQELAVTPTLKSSPTAFNGYNAAPGLAERLCKKFLPEALKNCKL